MYRCDEKLAHQSHFFENYQVKEYVDSGLYSSIYRAVDLRDKTQWAIKVVDKSREYGLLQYPHDVKHLALSQGRPEIIQLREAYDLGSTGILVTQWADGDLKHRNESFRTIKDDYTFRVLAKQMLEAVQALDTLGLNHSEAKAVDFLYVAPEGRIKISALERAEWDSKPNDRILVTVFNALEAISANVELSSSSQSLLESIKAAEMPVDEAKALEKNNVDVWLRSPDITSIQNFSEKLAKANAACLAEENRIFEKEAARKKPKANELLKHEAFSDIPEDVRLELSASQT
ncbi:hypothetical protein GZ78_09260 [Endozoicomonas numazuensis]|uniref:Protein kinase domain-containing protein n=1 Tax=Endozoicomonas numazuensis TaxID=1137799 RepID=A0A081NHB4_9GAMM|nr:hypothetical protein GZ78_09260 [Endozoicomonas numazuensis]